MKRRFETAKSDAGAALLLALWALLLLSTMVIGWVLTINSGLIVSSNANQVLQAEAMASSGAEVALSREVSPSSPNLHRKMANRQSYDVRMTGECGRLNLNFLVQGEDPRKLAIVRRYLDLKGVELNDQDTMIDSLLDWVSPNQGLHHMNAPEESDDYHPPHAPLNSVDELKKVFGWSEFTSKPNWDQDFTVVANCGAIDIAWASRDVLRALGIGDDFVDRFLQLRQGPDGIDGTEDDFQFNTTGTAATVPPEVLGALGLNQQQFQQIQPFVQFKGPVLRIVSVGKSGDITRSVEMVVLKQTLPGGPAAGAAPLAVGRPQVFSWKEL